MCKALRLFSALIVASLWLAVSHAQEATPLPAPRNVQEAVQQEQHQPPRDKLPSTLDQGHSLNPALFDGVIDNTLGLTKHDTDAYYHGLNLAYEVGMESLEHAAVEFRKARKEAEPAYAKRKTFPAFVDLFQHPQLYRGRPVALTGYIRRLARSVQNENSYGVKEVYEGYLYTEDSQSNPAVIVFLEKPENMPIGGNLVEEVTVAGYFLKMVGYEAQDTTRKAPMILAGTVNWRPQNQIAKGQTPEWFYAMLVIGTVLVILWLWAQIVGPGRQRMAMPGESAAFAPPLPADVLTPEQEAERKAEGAAVREYLNHATHGMPDGPPNSAMMPPVPTLPLDPLSSPRTEHHPHANTAEDSAE